MAKTPLILKVFLSKSEVVLRLVDGRQVLGAESLAVGPGMAEQLTPTLDKLFKRTKMEVESLSFVRLAVEAGLKNTTSYRIILAFVKGLRTGLA